MKYKPNSIYLINAETEIECSNKIKTVKKIEYNGPDLKKTVATFRKDGQLEELETSSLQDDFLKKKNSKVEFFYDKIGQIIKLKHTLLLEFRNHNETFVEFQEYEMLKSNEPFTESRFIFSFNHQDTLGSILFEKINNQTQTREFKYFSINTSNWALSIKDTINIKRLLTINEANKRFEMEDLLTFGHEIYKYEKEKPIEKKCTFHRKKELGEEQTIKFKYYSETRGKVILDGKVTNTFTLDENNLANISPDGFTEIIDEDKFKIIYDQYGNWITQNTSFIDGFGNQKKVKIKRKIEYYD